MDQTFGVASSSSGADSEFLRGRPNLQPIGKATGQYLNPRTYTKAGQAKQSEQGKQQRSKQQGKGRKRPDQFSRRRGSPWLHKHFECGCRRSQPACRVRTAAPDWDEVSRRRHEWRRPTGKPGKARDLICGPLVTWQILHTLSHAIPCVFPSCQVLQLSVQD